MSTRCSISNCVCTFHITLGKTVDLAHLARSVDAVEYSPKKFAAASLRLKDPKSSALVFSSGAVVVTGAQTEYSALMAGRRYCQLLRQADASFGFYNFTIQNVVGSAKLPGLVKLRELADACGEHAQYNPDLFPGLVLRFPDQPCAVLLFRSSSCIVTGGRSSAEVRSVFNQVRDQLLEFVEDGSQALDGGNSAAYAADEIRQRLLQGDGGF